LPYGSTNFVGTINGANNLLWGNAQGQNNPGFVDLTTTNLHLLPGSRSIDAAGPQAPAVAGGPYDIALQYAAPTGFLPRSLSGSVLDLGAFEWTATNPPVPALSLQVTAGNQGLLSWPLTVSGFRPESATNPLGPWTPVPQQMIDSVSAHTVSVPLTNAAFFRLTWP
jgi:hypothetical protein